MQMTVEQYRRGFRDGTLAFYLPAAHAEISNDFLDDFSQRVLNMDWREVSWSADWHIPAMLSGEESEEEVASVISSLYDVDVSDLPGLPFWDVARRCAKMGTVPIS